MCTCLLKDSQTYLDHINGRKHQKKLGMTMKVGRVGVDDVRDRVRQWTERKEADTDGRGREAAGRKRKRAGGEEKEGVEDDTNQGDDQDEHTAAVEGAADRKEVKKEASAGSDSAVDSSSERSGDTRPAELDRTAEDEEEAMMAAMGFNFAAFGGSKKT